MQIVDYNYFSTNYDIYSTKLFGNSIIYDVDGTLVKQPKGLSFYQAEYTKSKLEILLKNPSDCYVEVLELYAYLLEKDIVKFFAYAMPKLEDNLLNRYKPSQYTMEEKNKLLLKIDELVTNGNAEGIYNHDIWLRNFHLSADGKLTGLDVDSLAIGSYKSDKHFQYIYNPKSAPKSLDNKCLQNISMLECCLELWCNPITLFLSLRNYQSLIEKIDIDPVLKQMMVDVFECKGVDMKELISHMPSDGKYLKKSL